MEGPDPQLDPQDTCDTPDVSHTSEALALPDGWFLHVSRVICLIGTSQLCPCWAFGELSPGFTEREFFPPVSNAALEFGCRVTDPVQTQGLCQLGTVQSAPGACALGSEGLVHPPFGSWAPCTHHSMEAPHSPELLPVCIGPAPCSVHFHARFYVGTLMHLQTFPLHCRRPAASKAP
ncbi:kit ligand [Platysternon megacephalum]|uniref:Kit ligand n=1 Tax=Platysternon megacephalum TaxID=55544 RepID=A0A4D9EHH2_9SAUR|nr:kit ligand [Platysternon megacephalum]